MDNKIYAPVLIPTLNRYEHFKRCLESLEKCTGAEQTDVYIGLDYPPSEKYIEGWEKIDKYLADKEKNNGFKNLYVRRRDHNCGIEGPGNNYLLLWEEIYTLTDRFITSEDDNEFSPNFLEYINWGLSKYKDDERVMSICGYVFPEVKYTDNVCFLSPISNALGKGIWTNRRYQCYKEGPDKFVLRILNSWKLSWTLFTKRAQSLHNCLSMNFRKQYYADCIQTIDMLLTNHYSVFPSISKVRNWGHDGSGLHCGIDEKYSKQPIDKSTSFICTKQPQIYNISHDIDFGFLKKTATIIRYIGYRTTNRDWMSFYWRRKKSHNL